MRLELEAIWKDPDAPKIHGPDSIEGIKNFFEYQSSKALAFDRSTDDSKALEDWIKGEYLPSHKPSFTSAEWANKANRLVALLEESDAVAEDGLYRSERAFVWFGDRHIWLTENMMNALEVLFKAYKQERKVLPNEMENKIGNLPDGGFFKVFEVDRAGWEKVHPVRKIVGGRANSGWYLIKKNSSQT
jgi:hypothetical protein